MASRGFRPRQARAVELIRAGLIHGAVDTERTIPESSRSMVLVMEVAGVPSSWGIVAPQLGDRTVVVEHHARPPRAYELGVAWLKASYALARWLEGVWPADRRPLLLVLSVGRPRSALRCFRERAADAETPGIYRTRPGSALEVLLVDVVALPARTDTAFLRCFDHREARAVANLECLYRDPEVDTMLKRRVEEAVMEKPKLFTPGEHSLSFEEAVDLGREEGERTLLTILLERRFGSLPDRVRARLRQGSSADLEHWATRLLTARSLDAVIDG